MKKRWLLDGLCYILGSVSFAVSVSVFSEPHNIAPGGTAGLGIVAHEVFGVPVGAVVLLCNIPLLVAAFFLLGHSYTIRSAAVIVLSSVVIDITSPWLPPFGGERLLAALCGGLLSGIGIGIVMLRGASTGGSDIAAGLLCRRFPHWSMGRLMLAVDAVVIALSVIVFRELSAALYAGVQVFVTSLTIDRVLYGHQEGRLLLVVSRYPTLLATAVTTRLSRGVTVVDAKGGYTGEGTALLLCAVSRVQMPYLRDLVCEVDPTAFTMVVTTEQVVGNGFLSSQTGQNLL